MGSLHLLVVAESLTKRYRDVCALEACTLTVARGEVLGLLGPNGAGKTTFIRLLLGYLQPTAGSASIGGFDCYRDSLEVRRLTAYLPGEAQLFRTMRGKDVLQFFAGTRPGSDVRRYFNVAERLDLDLSRRVAQMSTGMRQKLALAATIAADTALLILDEPTANLDPTVRGEVIAMVLAAKQAGRTVIFSSHVLSEVEEACDRVVILRSGRLVHSQGMSELRRQHRIQVTVREPLGEPPHALAVAMRLERHGDSHVTIETSQELAGLLEWLAHQALEEVRIESIGLRGIYDRFHGSPNRPLTDGV